MRRVLTLLQLAYEAYKAKKIIASRDISYAFTNVMANNYYSLSMSFTSIIGTCTNVRKGSYDHFCFFNHISDSTKRMDDFAFFVFFTFKSGYMHHNQHATVADMSCRLEAVALR